MIRMYSHYWSRVNNISKCTIIDIIPPNCIAPILPIESTLPVDRTNPSENPINPESHLLNIQFVMSLQ